MKAICSVKPIQKKVNIEKIIEGTFDFDDQSLPHFRTGVRMMPHFFKLAYHMLCILYHCSRESPNWKKADASYSRMIEHKAKIDDIRFEEWSRNPRLREEAKKSYLRSIKATADACAGRPSKWHQEQLNEIMIDVGLKTGMSLYEIEAVLKNQS